MEPRRTKYYLNKQDSKHLGVCSGLADYTGIDALWIRLGFVILTISFGWPLIAYYAIGWLAQSKPTGLYDNVEEEKFWQGVRANPARSARDVRASFRDLDRRLADVELFYTSRNTQLADEIEALR
ncbi:MAG: PspC domain-containing protein [Sphingomonadaceae bacterium]|nr:PspC domain-containing protein [Sphingomonadaceae bacterium]